MAPAPLEEYQRKRDFSATPEPRGAAPDAAGSGRFVIQQHSATRLHWDLRLEHEGVLLSWALPRGLPWDPGRNHLAVHTEDHPIEYLDFEGDIPDGEYGAGNMFVWDTGTYAAEKIEDAKVVFTLSGRRRAEGTYALFRTRGRDWMIHRMTPAVDPERRHLPDGFALVRPVPGARPRRGTTTWALETRWRGLRTVLTSSGGIVELELPDGGGRVTDRFPEVRPLGRQVGYTEIAVDGIVTAPAGDETRIGRRLAAASDTTHRRLARDAPITFVAVDLLWQDGHPLTDQPWEARREALEALRLEGPAWTTPSAYTGDPTPMLEAAATSGVAELVAKRVDSPYDPEQDPPPWRIVTL